MDVESNHQSSRKSFRRAFLPLWIACLLGALVVGWNYHREHAPLVRVSAWITIDGKPPEQNPPLTVDGEGRFWNRRVSIGFHKVEILEPDLEPYSRRLFVWYNENSLGRVDLKRSRGSLVVDVTPKPDQITLRGRYESRTTANGRFDGLPVGTYTITSHFGRIQDSGEVQVLRNQTNRIQLKANVGTLELSSESAGAKFKLEHQRITGVTFSGELPARLDPLNAGTYRLTAWLGDYRKEFSITVPAQETVKLPVKFDYGTLEVLSEPSGADVVVGGKVGGTTPWTGTKLVPGTYSVELRKDGFDPVTHNVNVEGDKVIHDTTVLVNTRYRIAMERARRALEERSFDTAVESLEAALSAKPGDGEASKLLPEVRAKLFRQKADALILTNDYFGADTALAVAETSLPNDPETARLKEKLKPLLEDAKKRDLQVRFQKALDSAKREAAKDNFEQAVSFLAEARRLNPTDEGAKSLEPIYEKGRDDNRVAVEGNKRKDEAVFNLKFIGANDPAAHQFQLFGWMTTKSTAEVEAALTRIAAKKSDCKLSEVTHPAPYLLTAKMGNLLPLVGVGSFLRIVVVTYKPGMTQVIVRGYALVLGPNGAQPEPASDGVASRINTLKRDLMTELGNDLRSSSKDETSK